MPHEAISTVHSQGRLTDLCSVGNLVSEAETASNAVVAAAPAQATHQAVRRVHVTVCRVNKLLSDRNMQYHRASTRLNWTPSIAQGTPGNSRRHYGPSSGIVAKNLADSD